MFFKLPSKKTKRKKLKEKLFGKKDGIIDLKEENERAKQIYDEAKKVMLRNLKQDLKDGLISKKEYEKSKKNIEDGIFFL